MKIEKKFKIFALKHFNIYRSVKFKGFQPRLRKTSQQKERK